MPNLKGKRADSVVTSITKLGRRGFSIQADSADPEAIKRAVSEAVETLGGLDILVNSAAVGLAGPVAQVDLAEFQMMMDVNVRGPFCCRTGRHTALAQRWSHHLNRVGLGRKRPFSRCNGLRDVEVGAALFYARPVARTWSARHYGKSCPAGIDQYRGEPGRW